MVIETDWELLRHKFIRDPGSECVEFLTKDSPRWERMGAMEDCETDGHYLCAECICRKKRDEEEDD